MKAKVLFVLLATVITVTSCKDPSASFTMSSNEVEVGDVVMFTNGSTDGYFPIWDFGDGGTSEAVNPTHVYRKPGVYTVTLAVFDKKEKEASVASQQITVNLSELDEEEDLREQLEMDRRAIELNIMREVWDLDKFEYLRTENGVKDNQNSFTLAPTSSTYNFVSEEVYVYTNDNNNESSDSWRLLDANRIVLYHNFTSSFNDPIYTIKSLTASSMVLERITTNTFGGTVTVDTETFTFSR